MRRWWIPALVVAALAAILFLWDLPREKEESESASARLRLTELDPELVDTLRVAHGTERLELVRRQGDWWLSAPIGERADDASVQGMLVGLCRARAQRVVSSGVDSTALDAFGLGGLRAPQDWIEMTAPGRPPVVYDLGRKNPSGEALYLRVRGRDEVLLVDQSVGELGRITYQAFRIYDLFDVEEEEIGTLEVRNALGSFAMRRNPRGLWFTLAEPPQQLRRRRILDILYDLANARIRRFVADGVTPEGFRTYGLDDPLLELAFEAKGRERRLRMGNESEEELHFFARRDTQATVLVIGGDLLPVADLALEELLEHNPVPDNYALLDSVCLIWHTGERLTAVPGYRGEWDVRPPPGWAGEPDHFLIVARNLEVGLENLSSDRTVELSDPSQADAYLSSRPVRCELYWPDRTVSYEIGWRSGEDAHWLQILGESRVHRIPRDLFFRIRAVFLSAGLLGADS